MTRTESLRDRIAEAINDVVVVHPMWIDDDDQPLEYTPERESRISEFVNEAAAGVLAAIRAPQ